jgi:hypothetical protein
MWVVIVICLQKYSEKRVQFSEDFAKLIRNQLNFPDLSSEIGVGM